jgi:hypothetical protein
MVRQRGTVMTPFAGTNRIRFDGCDLSPERGTPVRSTLAKDLCRLRAPSDSSR